MNARLGGVEWPFTMRTDFPSDSRIIAMPSSLPKASQSGRIWLTSTKCWFGLMISANRFQSMGIGRSQSKVQGPRSKVEDQANDLGPLDFGLLTDCCQPTGRTLGRLPAAAFALIFGGQIFQF